MGLQQIERRLERMVEGTFARAFKGGLQPVEIGKRIVREMDLRRAVGLRHVIAPNVFEVVLSEKDMKRFEPFHEALVHELKEAVREHAKAEGYSLVGPVELFLDVEPSLKPGVFMLGAEVREQDTPWYGLLTFDDGTELPLGEGVLTVGRLSSCDVVFSDPGVSRNHAEIRCFDDKVVLVDLGSTNGTKVNGMPARERNLEDGDVIAIGNSTIHYKAL
jgi:hypothetical protein